ncbi:NAD(P)-dependent oxidoreductase [candidate division KSB1 bacterium]|nr:NAD(P)-dependent oxidoreductase [candidate division KSB1 bacterium]
MEKRKIDKVFVLGGSGFIGSVLVDHLIDQNIAVNVLVHRRPVCHPGVGILDGNLLTFDWKRLEKDLPDAIVHLARISARGRLGRRLAARLSNHANRRLVRWMKKLPHPPLLVLVAGTLAYGSHGDTPIAEQTPLTPTSFARDYSVGEKPIVDQLDRGEIPVQVMRPCWVYGEKSWFDSFFRKPLLQTQCVPLYGSGDNWMSLIHVRDVAGLICHLIHSAPAGETYNLFCGEPIRQSRFVQILCDLTGYQVHQITQNHLCKKRKRAIAEAFEFSLRVDSKHRNILAAYSFSYPDLRMGLAELLKSRQAPSQHEINGYENPHQNRSCWRYLGVIRRTACRGFRLRLK